jgi:hypothetical protein
VPPTPAKGSFVDKWPQLGLKLATAAADKGKMVEPSSSAGIWADLDKDGLVDFVVVDGIDRAYWGRALSPWKWYDKLLWQAKEPGLAAVAVTDADADGYPEIVLGGGRLYDLVRLPNGEYSDEAAQRNLAVSKQARAQHIQTADIDEDGLLDLVVTEYACAPQATLHAFINQGNHRYADESKTLGVAYATTAWFTLVGDVDGDGHPDLLVGHEACDPDLGNAWLHNDGPAAQPRFKAKALPPVFVTPATTGGTPMGGAMGDFDGNGLLDLVLTETGLREMVSGGVSLQAARANPALAKPYEMGGNHLLLRQADGSHQSAGLAWGLGWAASSTGRPMTSWSALPLDFDGDGWLDLLMTHGFDMEGLLLSDEGGERPVLLRNQAGQGMQEVSAAFGLPDNRMGRALAAADVDADGDLDFFMGAMDGQPALWRNELTHPNHWLQVDLRGTTSNVWGIGAVVELDCGDRVLTSVCSTQAPTQTASVPMVHFGVPASCVPKELRVRWPSGFLQRVVAPALDKRLVVQEPPLVTVSQRWVSTQQQGGQVTVQARAFTPDGQPQSGVAIDIALGPAAKGSWLGPTACDSAGICSRIWQIASGKWGADAVVVSIGGQQLQVRPVIRFDTVP